MSAPQPTWTRSPAAWTACALLTLAAIVLMLKALSPSATTQSTAPAGVVQRININTASVHELDLLPEIGPALARRIIDHRTEHGPFETLDHLDDVSGIGPKTIAALRDHAVASDN